MTVCRTCAERAAADEERERFVLVGRPRRRNQPSTPAGGGRDDCDRRPENSGRSRAIPAPSSTKVRAATSFTGRLPAIGADNAASVSHSRAHVRIQVPERARLRSLQADRRTRSGVVPGVRRLAGRDGPLPGAGPLPRLRLLLDGLRPRRPQEGAREGSSSSRLGLGGEEGQAGLQRRRPPRPRSRLDCRYLPKGVVPTAAGANSPPPGRGRLRSRLPGHHPDHGDVVLVPTITDAPPADVGPPRRQWSALPEPARFSTHPSWTSCQAERSVVSGLEQLAAVEREVENGADAEQLAHRGPHRPICWRSPREMSVSRGSSWFSRMRE